MATFEELGWPDPFPVVNQEKKESKYSFSSRPKKEVDKAKEIKKAIKRYMEKLKDTIGSKKIQSLALPNKKIMFKMMRACIGCNVPEKLWIYIDPVEAAITL